MTHKQIYIYTYKYKTVKRSRPHAINAHASQYRINSLISYTHPQAQNASHLYMGKMHKPHNAPSHTISDLHICGDSEKLHNALCISVLSLFCNHIENIL